MYKPWTEPETRILMNWQEIIENPDEFDHGVAIVEKLTDDKREFSAPGLVVSQNRKMGNVTMVFYVREDNE